MQEQLIKVGNMTQPFATAEMVDLDIRTQASSAPRAERLGPLRVSTRARRKSDRTLCTPPRMCAAQSRGPW
jgi:hypothetical protein